MTTDIDEPMNDDVVDAGNAARSSDWAETFKAMSTTAVVLGATLIILSLIHI